MNRESETKSVNRKSGTVNQKPKAKAKVGNQLAVNEEIIGVIPDTVPLNL
ncbi:MAG: hypothetical protein BWY01_01122 [Synergistetes bacterium ADurb.Bin155]|jgi:hypothetical protein|nr:MAG: hypothetical protein BWY01_01122 [Synergistetes bacterium ADurb.Bin155]